MVATEDVSNYYHARKDVAMVSSRSKSGINQLRKDILKNTGHLRSEKYYIDKSERQKEKEGEKQARKWMCVMLLYVHIHRLGQANICK